MILLLVSYCSRGWTCSSRYRSTRNAKARGAEQQSNLRVIRALLTLARNRKIPWGAPELQEILDPLLVRMWIKLLKEGRGLTGFLKGMKDQTAEAAATAYEATVAAEK